MPVNAGLDAARHLLTYLRYHAGGPRRPAPRRETGPPKRARNSDSSA
jgi:hypothetical protein